MSPSFFPPHPLFVLPAASYGAYPICKGCSVCSRDNGCVNCQPKLFLFLRRERMRQYGECLHDCPAGYYGMRSPELNMCSSKILSSLTYPASLIHSPKSPSTLGSLARHTIPPPIFPQRMIYCNLLRGDAHAWQFERLIRSHRWM